MKFNTQLEQAMFLCRKGVNIIEAEAHGDKINVLCLNDSLLQNCAVLGSNIWYTKPSYVPSYVPATWQLAEVDYGNLTLVNKQLSAPLFIEGFINQVIKINKLNAKTTTIIPDASLFGSHSYSFNLRDHISNTDCYIHFVHSIFNSDLAAHNCNYFPEASYTDYTNYISYIDAKDELYSLIHAKLLGHRSILCCFVCSQGTDRLCLTSKYNKDYAKLLKQAIACGVEFIAYRVDINQQLVIEVADTIIVENDL